MRREIQLNLSLSEGNNPSLWRDAVSRETGISTDRITGVYPKKRSIDARQRDIRILLQVEAFIDEPAQAPEVPQPDFPKVKSDRQVIIVGCGPAGMFAALRLIEQGVKPIILERGKDASTRRFDLKPILMQGTVYEDSNYCFGEGGAGTYSDGKLYTRSVKRGDVGEVLRLLVAHGANPDIMIDAHPHIGSNLLPNVVMRMRKSILEAGGEVHFETRVTDFILEGTRLKGVTTANGQEFIGEAVLLATGHSARDIFSLLHNKGIRIEAKPFALGVRIEHPQALIDEIQYRCQGTRHPLLPAASYRLTTNVDHRGIFSFCMCPGGFIVPATTKEGEQVVNGMSLARRDSIFANSGMVVSVELSDLEEFKSRGPLAALAFQQKVEQIAWQVGGGAMKAPAQRVVDFLVGKQSATLPETSYKPGMTSTLLDDVLPPNILYRLREGLAQFGKNRRGYITNEAVLLGVESRTSSPVRIPRDRDTLEHPEVSGLFPCGEGGGYAGGIISAALDGRRVAEAIAGKIA